MGKKVKAHVVITGKVQGVFFRMETKQAADRYGVQGWARNKSDGSVEALFEGDKEKVASIVEWCRQGPPFAKVNNIDVDWQEYKGEFKDFKIRY
jgi:acylphosphatase